VAAITGAGKDKGEMNPHKGLKKEIGKKVCVVDGYKTDGKDAIKGTNEKKERSEEMKKTFWGRSTRSRFLFWGKRHWEKHKETASLI